MSAVHLAGHVLTDPIAVFDAGIGSYSAVAHIHRRFPEQDLVCLADRASFPYGLKTLPELRATIERTLDYLAALPVAAVVVASNVPSVTMLDDAIAGRKLPVSGIVPPVREALGATDGDVAVLGVRTLVASAELTGYIAREAGPDIGRVHARDASSLVELVESGAFLFAADQTRKPSPRTWTRWPANCPTSRRSPCPAPICRGCASSSPARAPMSPCSTPSTRWSRTSRP
jgi:glutamate racemase